MSRRWRWRMVGAIGLAACLIVATIALLDNPPGDRLADPPANASREAPQKATKVDRPSRPVSRCQGYRIRSDERADTVTGSGERVVVLGDSWAVGRDVPYDQTWPVYLDGEIHVAGFPGATLSKVDVNKCGDVSFADRAPAALAGGADLVVIEGGLNDVRRSDDAIRAGFRRLMRELEGYDVVLLAPHPAPSRAHLVPRVDQLLSELAGAAGVPYIPTDDISVDYLRDNLHPSLEGHRQFGTAVADRISALGL